MKKTLLLAAGLMMSLASTAQISLVEGWKNTDVASARSMVYNDGKVYVASASAIDVFDAYTGEKKTSLSTEGVDASASYFKLSGITALGGKIFASSCINAGAGGKILKIYSWANDNADPVAVVTDETIYTSLGATGAMLASQGDLTNGKLIVNDNATTKIAYYTVTNGEVSATPTTISLTKDDAEWKGDGSRGCATVVFNEDGSFWVDAKGQLPSLFNAAGVWQGQMKTAVAKNGFGSAVDFISFKGSKYAFVNQYLAVNGTSIADGVFAVVDVTNGATAAGASECLAVLPEEGIGPARNTNFLVSIDCATRNNGEDLDVWAFVSTQGLVYYSTDETVAIEEVEADANAPVEYYNLQGVKVANPEKGLFIKKQGNKATKVVL